MASADVYSLALKFHGRGHSNCPGPHHVSPQVSFAAQITAPKHSAGCEYSSASLHAHTEVMGSAVKAGTNRAEIETFEKED